MCSVSLGPGVAIEASVPGALGLLGLHWAQRLRGCACHGFMRVFVCLAGFCGDKRRTAAMLSCELQ